MDHDVVEHLIGALETGSSKGIGEAIAIALAREGVRLVVHGRDREQAQCVVDVIAQEGRAYAVSGDLIDDDAVERVIAEAEAHVGAIGILVNNAGGSGPKDDCFRAAAASQRAMRLGTISSAASYRCSPMPLHRVGELAELAEAVAFLASPRAAYITGVNLHVDGGFSSIP